MKFDEDKVMYECEKCTVGRCLRFKSGDKKGKKAYKCRHCGKVVLV